MPSFDEEFIAAQIAADPELSERALIKKTIREMRESGFFEDRAP